VLCSQMVRFGLYTFPRVRGPKGKVRKKGTINAKKRESTAAEKTLAKGQNRHFLEKV